MESGVPVKQNSFVKSSGSNFVDPAYKKYMTEVPAPEYLSEAELHSVFFDRKADILKQNCLEFDMTEGIVKVVDKETVEKTRSVTMEMLTRIGKSLFKSNALGLSMPCVMFEPRSETDRMGELWRLICYFNTKASKISDKVERFKLLCTAEIAANYLGMRKMKSFNPLLGETFECTIGDGSSVALEQISHHPPVTAYYVSGPKNSYVQYGSEEYVGEFKGNHLLLYFKTIGKFRFRDGQEITWIQRPSIKVAGLLFGENYLIIKGMEIMVDRKNNIKAVLFFDYGEKKGLFSSKKTVSKDKVEGIIYVPKEDVPSDGQEKCIADLKDVKTEIARIKGSWFESVTINDVNYWNIDKILPLKITLPLNPLPSDCRYREDLVYLRRGDISSADAWKDTLEIRQRQDRKLRETYSK